MALPLPSLPVSPRVLPSSALFALVSLQVHKKKKKNISFLCILICISFAFRVYLLLFARTCLWWYYYSARMVLWCVIARKNDFCGVLSPTRTIFMRGNHAPQGLQTLGRLTLVFTLSHVVLPSVWLCLVAVISGMKNVGRKFSNAFRRVTRSSSSRSSSHCSSTPTPSFNHHDEQAESQEPKEQVEQQEEEAPDDSHIDL